MTAAHQYETMMVVRSSVQEAGIKAHIERVHTILKERGADIAGTHEWGMRELAYPIEKERRGYYVIFEYQGSAGALDELERQLKLSDDILRYVSVRQGRDALPGAAARGIPTPPAEPETAPAPEAVATSEAPEAASTGEAASAEPAAAPSTEASAPTPEPASADAAAAEPTEPK